ncbi:MAG: family 16 glycoside hydrolase [Bacteroidota bacterium]
MKLRSLLFLVLCWVIHPLAAQKATFQFPMTELSLDDLSAFQTTKTNWQIVGTAQATLDTPKKLQTSPGKGVLVNLPDDKNKSQIFTTFEHGDIDLEVEVMMPRGSNSGIYLQGRYEIQLLDSWGKKRPTYGDMGGIYQRWDDQQPQGENGFEGTPPLVNAAKAPGLWQKLRLSFQAPRFDAQGNKIQNARIVYAELNGVTIHENVTLTGPTRGPYVGDGDEAAKGAIVIQGDHGPVAFRNFKYRLFDGQPVAMKKLQYKAVRSTVKDGMDWSQATPEFSGVTDQLTWNVAKADNDFTILFEGQLAVPETGDYLLKMDYQGRVRFWLDGEMVFDRGGSAHSVLKNLPKGDIPFRLEYSKEAVWQQPQLGFSVEGAGFRPFALHDKGSNFRAKPIDPIYQEPQGQANLLRSFVKFQNDQMPDAKIITNAINVGDPEGLHYTYDLNQGSLVQVWRGDFLNMTPMWYNRGNGQSEALGVIAHLTPNPQIVEQATVSMTNQAPPKDWYRYRSYTVDEHNRPTFHYEAYGLQVADQLAPSEGQKAIQRQLKIEGTTDRKLAFCLAEGQAITKLSKDLYLVDEQYYVEVADATKVASLAEGKQGLIVPISGTTTLDYKIVW